MTLITMAGLFFTSILAGALNSVAGGGSFLTFPALMFSGISPINANATNTVALWPGNAASVGAYRKELAAHSRSFIIWLNLISLVGGVAGAILLLRTPAATFVWLVPWLLLAATVLFTVSPPLTRMLGVRAATAGSKPTTAGIVGIGALQLAISIYGGYFGGGMGIMILAALGLMGLTNIHEMNGLKTLLTVSINGVAVVTFVIAGVVVWPEAMLMLVGAMIGGYVGASYAKTVNPKLVRYFVIGVGFTMSAYYFFR